MGKGNFKVRCVDDKTLHYYTIGKIYDVTDGQIINDLGNKFPSYSVIDTFKDWVNCSHAAWELVEDVSFDWDGFKSAKFAVHCDTEKKAKLFFDELKMQGIKWCNGKKITNTDWNVYKEETCYGFYNEHETGISYGAFNHDSRTSIDYQSNFQEVKRLAKVGEWIKIVDAYIADDCYKNGDILHVLRTIDGLGVFVKTEKTHDCYNCMEGESYVYESEYVVLENNQAEPIQEEPYKVDWSKVTDKEITDELVRRFIEE